MMNGSGNSGSTITVLYTIVNSEEDNGDFNAFSMPRTGKGPTLASVKQHCAALHGLNHLGPEGYHWRVCVEDKPVPGEEHMSAKSFSWWDIQDDNASLPVKEATQSQFAKLFAPPKEESSTDVATKAAKGAFKSLGKAMSHAVAGHDGVDHGPTVGVVAFKLLDLIKMHDDFAVKGQQRGGHIPQPQPPQPRAPRAAAPRPQPTARQSVPVRQQQQANSHPPPPPKRTVTPTQRQPSGNLMGFDEPSAPAGQTSKFHRSESSPASFNRKETKQQQLKREYAQKQQSANRVWDPVDERWVEVDPNAGKHAQATASAPPGANHAPIKKEVGITLDPINAANKSAHVQAAVNQRVNDMKESQDKALRELRAVEEGKKKKENEEDEARKRLEPKVKAWAEEHGKKKQLRALLGSLHIILWPEAKWKPVNIGDILSDAKCKKCYYKASLVVHPDKTKDLDAEKRFVAKRVFDALTQAKADFDAGKK